MAKYVLNMDKYSEVARLAVAEGQVLLKNDNMALPLKQGERISIFGRIQTNYFKSGTGSGGMVNVSKVTGILDAFRECDQITVNESLVSVYEEWEKENPFDAGIGWGTEPWSQKEMPLTEELVSQAEQASDSAIVIIGRTAGEDKDNSETKGSYMLTDEEEDMLKKVRACFSKMVVVLNVGNIIDMSFMEKYNPDAVLYAWQGGMIGGYGTVDVLTGAVNPSGRLSDTIAYRLSDYPAHSNFGDKLEAHYQEDIYVGYRYFETFAKEQVKYPFGFGLSYTDFSMKTTGFYENDATVDMTVEVTNIGNVAGKQVVQIYAQCPQGKLGKPAKQLIAYEKTEVIQPGNTSEISITIHKENLASYDDSGITGARSSYVLEAGEYILYVGANVRDVQKAGSFSVSSLWVVSKCAQAMAPVKQFERMKPVEVSENKYELTWEEVPIRSKELGVNRLEQIPEEVKYTGDQGIRLSDVKNGKASMKEFIAQLTDEDLSCIIRGEGMGSPQVTPGTAAAFGGISDNLKKLGIPCGCCADGPSGMRIDCGKKAFSLPNGTLLACTFNKELISELYSYTGIEMVKNNIEVLLGPGMNIHRHPLNGRNFEYFSEDPYVTGTMAMAELKGLHSAGVTGCVKHFCANNQEYGRSTIDSIVSERALREIYLKGYEMAVRSGEADAIMTTYGAVNGIWTAGNYELNTVILRNEWGYQGIVMTDWWAKINRENQEGNCTDFAQMTAAQNDLYMVCQKAAVNSNGDNTLDELNRGWLYRGELQRNAMNICTFMMNTQAFARMNQEDVSVELIGTEVEEEIDLSNLVYYKVEDSAHIDLSHVNTDKGNNFLFAFDLKVNGLYEFALTARSDASELAQMPVTFIIQGVPKEMFTFNGTGGQWKTMSTEVMYFDKYPVQRLYFGQSGLELKEMTVTYKGEFVRE